MKKLFLAGIAALFLATGTAHTDCCDTPPVKPAGRPFYDAAKRHFGRGFSSVKVYTRLPEYCGRRYADQSEPEKSVQKECIAELANSVIVVINDARYLGLDEVNANCPDSCLLLCRYRTKPIRFFNCKAWEGE